jgi:imidazole glycerol-phosphate synthase subunit HisF
MLIPRVIPCLLLQGDGLVKTVRFKKPTYLGDPINIVKIFNDKEVDELMLCDRQATISGVGPSFERIERIASECFMPLGYAGGIRSLEDMRRLFNSGIEKVAINSYAVENPSFIRQASEQFGSQSVVVSLDVKKRLLGGYEVITRGGRRRTGLDPVSFAVEMEEMGAGEILLTSIDHDGTMRGYDIRLIRQVASAVSIPVVACGGARDVDDLAMVVREGGVSAAGAASMFVFNGPNRAVLISYPSRKEFAKWLR